MLYLWRVPGGCPRGLVVVEDDHHQVPVAIADMPHNPGNGVGVQHHGQKAEVGDNEDGAGENHHQTHKDLDQRRDKVTNAETGGWQNV